jgi:hypothetical protein
MSWFGRKQRFPAIAMPHIGQCFGRCESSVRRRIIATIVHTSGRSLIQINPNREQTMFPDAFAGLTAMIHLDSSNWNWPATRLLSPTAYRRSNPMRPYRGPAVGISEPFVGSSKWNLPATSLLAPDQTLRSKRQGVNIAGDFTHKKSVSARSCSRIKPPLAEAIAAPADRILPSLALGCAWRAPRRTSSGPSGFRRHSRAVHRRAGG